MGNEINLEEEYKCLNEHRKCLEDMVVEISSRIENLLQKAREQEERPKTAQGYLVSAEKEQKRLDALKVSLTLADNELLHISCNLALRARTQDISREQFLRSCSLEEMAETIADIAYAAMRHNRPALCDREYVTEWLKGEYDGK